VLTRGVDCVPSVTLVILCILLCVISGHFINFDIQQCHANRLFCNKVWQATKYIRMCIQNVPAALDSDLRSSRGDLSKLDKWILSRLAYMVSEVNKALTTSDFHIATSTLKTFLYSEFCDFYLVSRQHGAKCHVWPVLVTVFSEETLTECQ
jgi:valyl-tRNA synthetase